MPSDAALGYSPFLSGTLGGIAIGERFSSSAYLGAELGAFFGRWRVSARTLFPFGVHQPTGEALSNPEFLSIPSEKPALLYGVSAGAAAYVSTGFVASVGLNFMRSDVSDFGNTLGLSLPLEWITRWGLRVGVEPGFLHAFGGEVLGECSPGFAPPFNPSDASCDVGEIRAFDRESGNGFWVHFLLGIPFATPEPQPLGSSKSE